MDFSRKDTESKRDRLLRVAIQSELIKHFKAAGIEVTDCEVNIGIHNNKTIHTISVKINPMFTSDQAKMYVRDVAKVCADQMIKLGYEKGQKILTEVKAESTYKFLGLPVLRRNKNASAVFKI